MKVVIIITSVNDNVVDSHIGHDVAWILTLHITVAIDVALIWFVIMWLY
jgi:hypothetical protein